MSEVIGYTIVTHYADKSTQTTKMSAAQAAALVSVAGSSKPKYQYINADECPTHGAWRSVPGGVSKNTGKPYNAFWTCDVPHGEPRCTYKPSDEWVETHPPAATPPQESYDDLPF